RNMRCIIAIDGDDDLTGNLSAGGRLAGGGSNPLRVDPLQYESRQLAGGPLLGIPERQSAILPARDEIFAGKVYGRETDIQLVGRPIERNDPFRFAFADAKLSCAADRFPERRTGPGYGFDGIGSSLAGMLVTHTADVYIINQHTGTNVWC